MNVHARPIAVFDSGVGGLSVLAEIRRVLPGEALLYAADGRFCPYGVRPEAEIRDRCIAIGEFLADRGARLIVVACNTASSVALDDLRARLSVPVVGLEPAVKPAVALTRTGRIGVLATPRTAAGARLGRLIERHAAGVEVRVVSAPELVDLVEAGQLEGQTVEATLQALVAPLLAEGVDTIVLGCTHFPFLRQALSRVVGPGVALIDSGEAVAHRTRQLLGRAAPAARGAGSILVLTSGDQARTARISARLLRHSVPVASLAV